MLRVRRMEKRRRSGFGLAVFKFAIGDGNIGDGNGGDGGGGNGMVVG